VVSFTPLPLFPQEKGPWYPLDGRLGGLQSRSGLYRELKILDLTGTNSDTSVIQPIGSDYTDYVTAAHYSDVLLSKKTMPIGVYVMIWKFK
jgi:hypothetical protein